MTIRKEYSLKDHQSSAVETAIKRNGNILFSHPVGSGKTFTSIAAFEKLKEKGLASRALIVTPASLRENYGENGIRKFTDDEILNLLRGESVRKEEVKVKDYFIKVK